MDFYILKRDESTNSYIDQLNTAAKKGLIKMATIHVYGEMDAGRFGNVETFPSDGVGFLVDHLWNNKGEHTEDQLIPSHSAPHVLAKVMIELLQREGLSPELVAFQKVIGAKHEMELELGLKVVSYAVERCPLECRERDVCLLNREKITWNIGQDLKKYAEDNAMGFVGFFCANFAENVATIPMQDIVDGWASLKEMISSEGSHRVMIATHSRCHGIVALISI